MKNKLISLVIILSFVASSDLSNQIFDNQKGLDHIYTTQIYNQIQYSHQKFAKQHPLRITFDTTQLDSSGISGQQLTYLKNVLEISKNFMKEFIQVNSAVGNNVINVSKKCQEEGKVKVSSQSRFIGIKDSDLHIFIAPIKNSKSVTLSGICSLYKFNDFFRPNSGIIYINLDKIPQYDNKDDFTPYLDVMINQIIIILGFGGSNLAKDIDQILGNSNATQRLNQMIETETKNNISRKILKSPNVQATARKFYGCENLKGIFLEKKDNPDEISQHWDSFILPTEIMNGYQEVNKKRISVMTIAHLQDSGFWIGVNENFSNHYYWGKDKGCDFQYNQSILPSYYEQQRKEGCSFWNDFQSILFNHGSSATFQLQCKVMLNDKLKIYESLDDIGESSKCFASNLSLSKPNLNVPFFSRNTRCHQYECSEDEKQIKISFSSLPGFYVICNQNNIGKTITVDYQGKDIGTLTCPSNYNQFCDETSCLNNCSMNGFCIRGNCHCNTGFSGIDCSIKCRKYSFNGTCTSRCPDNTFANPDNTCKINCPKGYYKEEYDERKCLPCDFSCSKCRGSLPTECTACQFLTYLDGSTCVRTCPAGKYADESTKSCVES